jgi:ribonuclease P protein component
MLPAPARLRRGSDIAVVSRTGSRRTSGGLAVSVVIDTARQTPRAAVVVNRGVGNAVARNRLRRQVRHGLVRVWDSIPAGADLVVRANRSACSLTPAELDAALVRAARPRDAGSAGGRRATR